MRGLVVVCALLAGIGGVELLSSPIFGGKNQGEVMASSVRFVTSGRSSMPGVAVPDSAANQIVGGTCYNLEAVTGCSWFFPAECSTTIACYTLCAPCLWADFKDKETNSDSCSGQCGNVATSYMDCTDD